MINIRRYSEEDCIEIVKLFYDTVHSVNAADYTPEQLEAWAPENIDADLWNRTLTEHYTIIAEMDGIIAGFGDTDGIAYIDRLYVHKDHQHMGIASLLCTKLEERCTDNVIKVHASITAKPFFKKIGYTVIKEQLVERKGVILKNYVMIKAKK